MKHASNSPFFSVVIPVYNRLALLQRAVVSVLNQTYQDYEVTVVDDGSFDGDIFGVAALSHPKVRLVQQPHLGASIARNCGIARSEGRWIAFLDADDVWKESHLAELADLVRRFPHAGMVATSIFETADADWDFRWPTSAHKQPEIVDYFRKSARKKGLVHSSSVAIQREVAQAVGEFTPVPAGEDLEYWARVALVTQVAKSYKVTVSYLRSNGGTMESIARKRRKPVLTAPRVIEDLSPSIRFLWRTLERGDIGICKKQSLEYYINGGVDSYILWSVGSNYCANVSQVRNLYVSSLFRYISFARVLSLSPRWFLLPLCRLWKIGSYGKQSLKESISCLRMQPWFRRVDW